MAASEFIDPPGPSGHQPPAVAAGHRRQARREAGRVFIAMVIVVGAAIFGLLTTAKHSISDNFHHYLISLAEAASTLVDPSLQNQIRQPDQLNNADYIRAVEPLRRLRRTVPDIHYVYTLVLDDGDIHFVLDAAEPLRNSLAGGLDQSGVWEVYKIRSPAILAALGSGGAQGIPTATTEPVTDRWGTFMTGFAPIRDALGRQIGAVGVDVDASLYLARLKVSRMRAVLGLAPAGILIALLGCIYYRVRLRGLVDASNAVESAEAAKRAAEGLAEERRRLNAVIEGTDVGTWEWHSNSRSITVNDRWAIMFGRSPAYFRAFTPAKWRSLVHPDDLPAVRQTVAASVGTAEKVFLAEFRMRHAQGHWLWVLLRGKIMECNARGRPGRIGGIIMDICARKAMEQALIESAQQDRLTGLPNRTVFMERLELTLARVRAGEQASCSVLFLDFDRFKLVNDTLGHKAGDELLRQIAWRLQSSLRRGESYPAASDDVLISRFGGDEFLILLDDDAQGAPHAVHVAERLLNSLTSVYTVFGSEVHSMASVGIVTSDQCSGNAEEMVRNADVAMYEAKRAGRGCSVIFNEGMHVRLTRHVAIETCLRRAINSGELYLEYQPVVDLNSGERPYVEALVRWNHPTMGLISPNEFIPIAEESGLIVAVGQWVMEEACRTMIGWRNADPVHAPQMVSVNVSRAEIGLGQRLLARVQDTLGAAGLPPQCLQLEVTEREVMRNPEAARDLLLQLHNLGVQLSMDDFGTGTSSLSLLRGYPFDTIKIDRSFLQDLTTSHEVLAVIHATINLIENLGMSSLAEGVEDGAQVAILQSLGCGYAQGYYFSEPLSADEVLKELAAATAAAPGAAFS